MSVSGFASPAFKPCCNVSQAATGAHTLENQPHSGNMEPNTPSATCQAHSREPCTGASGCYRNCSILRTATITSQLNGSVSNYSLLERYLEVKEVGRAVWKQKSPLWE